MRVSIDGTVVGRGCRPLTDVSAGAVLGPRSRFYHNFGFTVSVKIVDQKLGIVGTCPDIGAQINTPQMRPIQGISIQTANPPHWHRWDNNSRLAHLGRAA